MNDTKKPKHPARANKAAAESPGKTPTDGKNGTYFLLLVTRTKNLPGDIVAYRRRPRKGEILCHNHVVHHRWMTHGHNDFRWFSALPDPKHWKECPCGWRPDLGVHHASAGQVKFWRDLKKKLRTQEAIDRHIAERVKARAGTWDEPL